MAAAVATVAGMILQPAVRRTSPTTFTRRLTTTASLAKKQLILYSKPGCCLCDGLKEKLHSAFTLSSYSETNSLRDVELLVRDISSNPEWEKAYQYEIPVLARLRSDGTEEVIPRFSPRAGVDHIQTKLAAVFSKEN